MDSPPEQSTVSVGRVSWYLLVFVGLALVSLARVAYWEVRQPPAVRRATYACTAYTRAAHAGAAHADQHTDHVESAEQPESSGGSGLYPIPLNSAGTNGTVWLAEITRNGRK